MFKVVLLVRVEKTKGESSVLGLCQDSDQPRNTRGMVLQQTRHIYDEWIPYVELSW